MNKTTSIFFGSLAISALILIYVKTKKNDELDEIYRKVVTSEALSFGLLGTDGTVEMKPLNSVMLEFWNKKILKCSRVNDKYPNISSNQIHVGYLELNNKLNDEKLYAEIYVPHEKKYNFYDSNTKIIFIIKGKEKSLIMLAH